MIKVKNTAKKFLMLAIVISTAVVFLLCSESASKGVINSMRLCASTVIPSLLPFMVLSGYVVNSGLMSDFGRFFERPCRMIFRLPGEAALIIIMSLTGGFPVGAKMISSAIEKGSLSKNQGRRMMLFCVNAGPAFIINAVGVSMLNSRKAGVILLVATVCASIIMGILSRFFEKKDKKHISVGKIPQDKSGAISSSVSDAVKSMILICGWIVVFGAVRQIVNDTDYLHGIRLWSDLLCEVTGGCAAAVNNFSLPVVGFVLGFSGFAVHAQILTFIDKCGLKYRFFFAARALNGAISAVIAELLFKLFPCTVQVFSSDTQMMPVAFSVSAYASAAAIFTAALIILDLAPKKKV